MRLYRQAEVPQDDQGMLCRQSRLAGVVRLIFYCGVLIIPVVLGWKFDNPWVLWIGLAVGALLVLMAALELKAQFCATNWLMRISPDGLWINLRSYKDRNIDPNVPSVVHLGYGEIASVGRHTESYSTPSRPSSNAPTVWRDDFLEIELAHDQTGELQAALNDVRFPPAPAQPPSAPMPVRGRVSSVWLVNPSLVRIPWLSGHGTVIAPRLTHVLSRLETRVRVAPPTRRERPNWLKLTPEEATDLARELVHVHGEVFASAALLTRVCHMTHGQASAQVQEFEAEAVG